MKLVLVSGYSGSGKSVALKALEDAGYFAVDNLPAAMVEGLLRELAGVKQIAVAIDIRAGESVGALPALVSGLRDRGVDCRLLFVEASDEAIARRFAETRRPHPLAERVSGGVQACIGEERRLLADIAELGHRVDTSGVNANRLRDWIKDWLQLDRSRISLTLQSFGFKHGIPLDADMVFDVRFLPNPYYDTTLRPLTGRDEPVKKFLQADADVAKFIDDVARFLDRWLPSFVRDHRAAVTVAIGCTGGQHRSVYISEQLAARFREKQQVLVRHRDIH
ncbi:MAG: RNase adapter RapZ [Burkholderiales bacterium]